ncbi:MAG TPA: type II toxin-antitoxin system RelE/ParE family toxin [Pseudomonadales bacterium]|nr:type II toxin-antitoxin system RelE/ParE family toxin [Pseudomonadales bacterium]
MHKSIEFLGNSLQALREFPVAARRETGLQLDRLQRGLEPADWKPMTNIGAGVHEIRVRSESNAYRTLYIAKLPEAIYVLHCFQKKSQKTPQTDLEIAKKRLQELMRKNA